MSPEVIIMLVLIAIAVVIGVLLQTGKLKTGKGESDKSKDAKVIVATPVEGKSTGGTTSKATIHKMIDKKADKKNTSPQDVKLILAEKETTGVWICPSCEVENPLSESVCCVCHYTKGR